jgi:NAD(P)-dependent dehydrogenase (short-subunit alcohol dehydrogenase family)
MNYFVTGATGFIGRFLVERLAGRSNATIYVLVREGSQDKFDALCRHLGDSSKKLVAIHGDITTPGLFSPAEAKKIKGKIDHVFHLAAVYDMTMTDAVADRVNVGGTRHVVEWVNGLGRSVRLHHMSSVAVAGADFVGPFTETMFNEGQPLRHPYYRTKFLAEKIVRTECTAPYRIYRPGVVVGHSETGEIDKIDGPYYFFKAVQRVSLRVPQWMPLLGVEGGSVPIVPVDYVVAAMDWLAHEDHFDRRCFHLFQAHSPTVGRLLEIFLGTAHGPEVVSKLNVSPVAGVISSVSRQLGRATPERAKRQLADAIGVPISVLSYAWNRTEFDARDTRAALRGSGIKCPDIGRYAGKLWSYWEQYLDINYRRSPKLERRVRDKVVLITGASSGIGFATSKRLAMAGAKVILVARTKSKLELTQKIIQAAGGQAYIWPCDLNDMNAIDEMAAGVLKEFGHVDFLINNAGRSIRRAVIESLDRFHDYERTMQLNYFGAIRLIQGLLPSMIERRRGHIINISSIGVLANAARFSAYVASKAALDAFTRCMSAEVKAKRIYTTAIYMPLVRTPMIAPTKLYRYVPTWSPDNAADTVVKAIVERPKNIATPLGTAASISYALWPKLNDYILSKGFELFPSSTAARSARDKDVLHDKDLELPPPDSEKQRPTLEQVVFANVFKGEHW